MDSKIPSTENESLHHDLDQMSTIEILTGINEEDKKVATAIQRSLPAIENLIDHIFEKMKTGGRLFYIGAGTSGRLGILDASECPPTFGVDEHVVIGLIAGGDKAIRKAVEHAEDDDMQAWKDLSAFKIQKNDSLIGIAASGTTPYVIGGLKVANEFGLITGCITCNPGSKIGKIAEFPVEVSAGPEFLTGSTRMKSGTVQKMVLNMISTSLMIKLGKVKGNKMVNMKLSNAKLEKRAVRMLMEELRIEEMQAMTLIAKHGSVRNAIDNNK